MPTPLTYWRSRGTVEYELINEFVEALDDHDNSDSDLAIQYEDLMVAHIDLAVDQLLDYTRMYPQPIIAVEDFGHSMPPDSTSVSPMDRIYPIGLSRR